MEKAPPIGIEVGQKKPERRKPLTDEEFSREEKPEDNRPKVLVRGSKSKFFNAKTPSGLSRSKLILVMLIPVVLSALMIFQFAPNKTQWAQVNSQFNSELQLIKVDLDAAMANISALSTKVENLINSSSEYAKTGELSTEINSIQASLDTIKERIGALEVQDVE